MVPLSLTYKKVPRELTLHVQIPTDLAELIGTNTLKIQKTHKRNTNIVRVNVRMKKAGDCRVAIKFQDNEVDFVNLKCVDKGSVSPPFFYIIPLN